MKLRPLGDRVLVRPIEDEERTSGGIVLPDTAKEKPQRGEVVAVGPGEWDEEGEKRLPLDVKVGDHVLFAKYAGTEVKIDGVEHLILRHSDILAIVEREPAAAKK
ncbi:MAG: co-chaperone GroES [Armatimonadota bacterium]|jgi:chaperonin GroES|nr:co-chaperone GroES [Armatimonadota bacterium]MDR7402289.1 co-chaperone GroES [Armatimonadota bacterium]MDR7403808.1 co-chaperone GroES [Armatimonadota bacterium]MDR7437623.1 co-chaperone GroES [Armatimonadota bacterium]MDR7472613.1 co-chaperone GroES [Armatimonadota bacterium]